MVCSECCYVSSKCYQLFFVVEVKLERLDVRLMCVFVVEQVAVAVVVVVVFVAAVAVADTA